MAATPSLSATYWAGLLKLFFVTMMTAKSKKRIAMIKRTVMTVVKKSDDSSVTSSSSGSLALAAIKALSLMPLNLSAAMRTEFCSKMLSAWAPFALMFLPVKSLSMMNGLCAGTSVWISLLFPGLQAPVGLMSLVLPKEFL